MFYQDLLTCLWAWARTRQWRWLLLVALIPFLFLATALSTVIYGAFLSRRELGNRYFSLVQSDVESSLQQIEKSENEPDGATSRRVQVPLRRLIQLGNSNEKVLFIVGTSLIQQGRTAMGASMLRDIAPEKRRGFPPAHAWLASYAMMTSLKEKETAAQAEMLLFDLETAEKGSVRLQAQQLVEYARLLIRFDRKQDALNMLHDHNTEYPQLNNVIIQLEKQDGIVGNDTRTAVAAGRADFDNKLKAGQVTLADLFQAVELEILAENIDRAVDIAAYGYKLDPKSADARRLYSSALLYKHRAVSEQWPAEVARAKALGTPPPPMDLRYLDLACEVDSANPDASEALAQAVVAGQKLSQEMTLALQNSLVEGTASGVTHLILANGKLVGDNPHESLPHLRMALRQMPDSPVVMNNLAYAILKYETEKLQEARELIERALGIPGVTLAERASMLDTLGEIRVAQDDTLGAIEMFEEALKHDGRKVNTRQKLADAYQQAGMQDLANAQLRRIREQQEE
jgi:tetratricopeptide (TPR) repeat protein